MPSVDASSTTMISRLRRVWLLSDARALGSRTASLNVMRTTLTSIPELTSVMSSSRPPHVQ